MKYYVIEVSCKTAFISFASSVAFRFLLTDLIDQILCGVTCSDEIERLTLRGEVMGVNMEAINAAVVPLVAAIHRREPETGRLIDSWQGVAER